MGDVVGEDLGDVRSAGVGQGEGGRDHHGGGQREGVGGRIEIGRGEGLGRHLPRLPKGQRVVPADAQRGAGWATTVTNGGRTTASSPGSTSVRAVR